MTSPHSFLTSPPLCFNILPGERHNVELEGAVVVVVVRGGVVAAGGCSGGVAAGGGGGGACWGLT